jgi:acetylornithine deacetylase
MVMAASSPTPYELIETLVGFDTTSEYSNLALIAFVRDYLDGLGIASTLVPSEDGQKANLWATIGPADRGGVVLSGHTDVVPVAGQDWSSDPFKVVERDGRLYGRGTADMKSFVAIALAMVPEFQAANLKTPIHLAFTYDEEITCFGVQELLSKHVVHVPRPKAVIVGEPSRMEVVNAHKSIYSFATEVTGHEAHSSATHKGVNAIKVAAELIAELNRIEAELRVRGDPTGRFDPPYTTIQVGVIDGGSAHNIIPKKCRFLWEFRGVPGLDPAEIPDRLKAFGERTLLPAMNAIAPETGIETRLEIVVPVFAPAEASAAETLALALARSNDTHTVAFGSEAGFFQAEDIPTVICGPGDIAQAHKPDEFIERAQVEECVGFMRRLAARLSQ